METLLAKLRDEAEKHRKEADDAKNELEEFMAYSRAMEAELDEELNAEKLKTVKQEKELLSLRLQLEKYKEESSRHRSESFASEVKRNKELKSLRAENELLHDRVRGLEQRNDDLERELRIKTETLNDTERRLNDELELRALLSTELDTKEELGEHCQRLEDEIRDLKLDNTVKETKIRNWRVLERNSVSDDRKEPKNGISKILAIKSPKINGDSEASVNGSTCSPLSSPIARNISPVISNLLKTIQGLEKKLLSMHPERNSSCESCLSPLNRR